MDGKMRSIAGLGVVAGLLACAGMPVAPVPAPVPDPAPAVVPPPPPAPAPVPVEAPKPVSDGTLTLGELAENHVEGCGCSYNAPHRRNFFESDPDASAWMNVGGVDVELRRVEGERIETFRGEGLTARVHAKEVSGCTPGEGDCEAVNYAVTVEVERNGERSSISGEGQCGC